MNEPNQAPKSIWKRPIHGWKLFVIRLAVLASSFSLAFLAFLYFASAGSPSPPDMPIVWAVSIGFALVATFGVSVLCWLFCRRNLRRTFFGLACFATLIALFYAEEDWRGKYDWDRFKREWEAKGEKFDRQAFIPPPVPDDQNFALTPVVASCYESRLDKSGHAVIPENANVVSRLRLSIYGDENLVAWPANDGNWPKAKETDLRAWQQYYRALAAKTNWFPVTPQPQTPARDVLLALSKYDSTIEELRAASRLPYSRFPLEYDADNPALMLLPHLAPLKSCTQLLRLRAVAELQNGQSDQALADVKLSLRLADSIRTEPILISHLVRIAMVTLTLQPVYEGLAEHKWSDAQLVELDQELAKLDFLADYQFAMRGEMVFFQEGTIDYLRHHRKELLNLSDSSDQSGGGMLDLVPSGWFYQNELHCARPTVEFYLPVVNLHERTVSPALAGRAEVAIKAETDHFSLFNVLERLLLPSLSKAAIRFAYCQNSVDLARVACALERCRLAHGQYPDALDALAPQFIAKLPHDIINGQPLHYRRTDDGKFLLYSVGWNETDDGGTVALTKGGAVDRERGDWVWQYPAK